MRFATVTSSGTLSQSIPQGDKQEFARSTGYDSSSSSPRLPPRLAISDETMRRVDRHPLRFRSIDRCSPAVMPAGRSVFPSSLSLFSFFSFFRLCLLFPLFIRRYAQVARARTGSVINPRLSQPIHTGIEDAESVATKD